MRPAGRWGRRSAFFGELAALGRPGTTHRSYGMDLLRWFRFTWAVEVPWDQATRAEARDYCRWIQLTAKPDRRRGQLGGAAGGRGAAGAPNPVTGRPPPGSGYAAATCAHSETVLRSFYDFHVEAGTGPMINPFPLIAGPGGRPGERAPQPDAAVSRRAGGAVPAQAGPAGATVHPG